MKKTTKIEEKCYVDEYRVFGKIWVIVEIKEKLKNVMNYKI